MKKVSIIIPAYNCEQTIHHCHDSICKQTYTNIEIVVIDDDLQTLPVIYVRSMRKKILVSLYVIIITPV